MFTNVSICNSFTHKIHLYISVLTDNIYSGNSSITKSLYDAKQHGIFTDQTQQSHLYYFIKGTKGRNIPCEWFWLNITQIF